MAVDIDWFYTLTKAKKCESVVDINGRKFIDENNILYASELNKTEAQSKTTEAFSFKWHKEDSWGSSHGLASLRDWLHERFGTPASVINQCGIEKPVILDAGCGAGLGGLEYWRNELHKARYLGVDITHAVKFAQERFRNEKINDAMFMCADISDLPFKDEVFDIIYCSEVMHHTNCTETTFYHLNQFLKPNGFLILYIYRKKGPIREFVDDYIREQLQYTTLEEAWKKLEPLTKLGIALGELKLDITVPEDIELLGIPKGKIDLQRFFYWNICKAFYHPDIPFEEMNHINFDWYAPKNAHRHTIDEVKRWCVASNLEIVHQKEELPGISIVARKK